MSSKYYAKLWVATCEKIHEIITKEKQVQELGAVTKPQIAHSTLAELFVSYTSILNDLNDIFDQTLQVQKRKLVQGILMTVTKRVFELRKELCAIELSEYFYIDHTLISSHLTPRDVCFNRPNYFPLKRSEEYNEIIAKYSKQQSELTGAVEKKKNAEFIESVKTKTEIEYTFLGMLENRIRPVESIQIIESKKEHRRSLVEVFAADFEKTLADTKAYILKTKSQTIKEDISDFIRNWFRVMYDAAGDFDIYPPAAKGGSMAILKGETMSPQEFAEYRATGKRPSANKQEKSSKPTGNKPANSKKTGKSKMEWNFSELSPSLINLETAMVDYEIEWICVDEIGNSDEKPYMDFILPDKFAEVHKELHLEVDERMREEYELLRQARCNDLGTKYKKPKPKGTGRKGKGKKKKMKRGPADITAARSIDSLIAELVENDILIDVPKKSFDEFIGDYNYLAYENRNIDMTDPLPCLGEVKSTIRSWTIGMGPLDFAKPKSICLLGPPGCGKKHLIYAVAVELGAVVFNLSSEVVCKYKENMPYFVHLVTKMATILQPSVLFIDGAHKPFIKKAPTQELKEEYKIIGKYLPKIIKSFKSSDRVLLMGATNEPWNCAGAKMKKCFEKFVLIPTEQYGDKFLIWQTGIQNQLGFIPDINISTLAKVNIEYSAAAILNAIDQVLTTSRLNMLRTCPLNEREFVYAMSKQEEPLGKKLTEKYRKWYVAADKLAKAKQQIGKDARKAKK